jgi:hypothetical protein
MYWFWINMPLAAVFFAAWTGVPLWLVLKHPDTSPESGIPDTPHQAQVAEPTGPQAADVHGPRHAGSSQLLAGAGR